MQKIRYISVFARAQHVLGEFFRLEAAGGIVLIAAAALAMLVANSPLADAYEVFRDTPLGPAPWGKSAHWWINDGLMAIFFLLVALEIKREVVSGQLSSRDQLLLPVVCAIGGVAVPALLYTALNHADAESMRGWAVPTATDIAFALGVLALLGSRVPLGMKLLLSTIAVADDLIAILIIALFYTQGLSLPALAGAAVVVVAMWGLNRRKVTHLAPYLGLGLVLWGLVLASGVHATLAGVVTGLMIPHYDRRNAIEDANEHSPLEALEHALHPYVAFGILPLFAFANAGLALGGLQVSDLAAPLPAGIGLGLVLGKPVGIVGAALLMRALGLARFPEGMDLRAMLGLGLLCGIGFTMSLFIAGLAFGGQGLHYTESVLGVLGASVVAALAGMLWLALVLPRAQAAR
ncbi:Na+/H+ antiporter NhaA [Thermomonas haemolytica]|uniref:Na(+)/H(+) antiporter NhaA n=1 Tax=Thermomonas haemolytica TaxID=141949 RepID=A0A4R3MYW5_9GAMM|nr:Na+/H+ antiporter NhaA [Thermomonas haemolytica]TCT21615.1 NhaA family Na+:H+ antiporter [Thermomonas haemolytica]TNY30252.1 Na+/H+ antiporter NhaA [Thermomonas haemolytica]